MFGGSLGSRFDPAWWLTVFPGLAIAITLFAVNLAGDVLSGLSDPNLRGPIERR
jgi:peptide/nickel transport system permease protein